MAPTVSIIALAVTALLGQVSRASYTEQPPCTDAFTQFAKLGCVSKSGSNFDFRSGADQGSMTVAKCTAICKGNSYRYAALTYYGVCYCGNVNTGQQEDDGKCNYKCGGDQSESCGGPDSYSIWQDPTFPKTADQVTVGDYQAQGCYTDQSPRSLGHPQSVEGGLTTEKCVSACKAQGYPYAGTEYGGECWCDSHLAAEARKAADAECKTPCSGDGSQTCGGANRINIYLAKDLESTEPCTSGVTSSTTATPTPTPTTSTGSTSSATSTGTTSTGSSSTNTATTSTTGTTTTSTGTDTTSTTTGTTSTSTGTTSISTGTGTTSTGSSSSTETTSATTATTSTGASSTSTGTDTTSTGTKTTSISTGTGSTSTKTSTGTGSTSTKTSTGTDSTSTKTSTGTGTTSTKTSTGTGTTSTKTSTGTGTTSTKPTTVPTSTSTRTTSITPTSTGTGTTSTGTKTTTSTKTFTTSTRTSTTSPCVPTPTQVCVEGFKWIGHEPVCDVALAPVSCNDDKGGFTHDPFKLFHLPDKSKCPVFPSASLACVEACAVQLKQCLAATCSVWKRDGVEVEDLEEVDGAKNGKRTFGLLKDIKCKKQFALCVAANKLINPNVCKGYCPK